MLRCVMRISKILLSCAGVRGICLLNKEVRARHNFIIFRDFSCATRLCHIAVLINIRIYISYTANDIDFSESDNRRKTEREGEGRGQRRFIGE